MTKSLGPEIIAQLSNAEFEPERLTSELSYCRAEAVWKSAIQQFPDLAHIEGEARTKLVDEFCGLERQRQQLAQREVLAAHGSTMPRGSMGQMGIIRSEIARKRGHMAVRKLVGRTSEVMQKIKPVMLMSPLSIASSFLPTLPTLISLLLTKQVRSNLRMHLAR